MEIRKLLFCLATQELGNRNKLPGFSLNNNPTYDANITGQRTKTENGNM